MDRDKSGESGAFLFSRRVPDLRDGRQSFPTNENSNLFRRGRRRWIFISVFLSPSSFSRLVFKLVKPVLSGHLAISQAQYSTGLTGMVIGTPARGLFAALANFMSAIR